MTKRQYEEQRPLVKETEHNGTGPEKDILNPARKIAGPTVSLEWVLVLFLLHIVPPHKARHWRRTVSLFGSTSVQEEIAPALSG
jgi:hypothetical protein